MPQRFARLVRTVCAKPLRGAYRGDVSDRSCRFVVLTPCCLLREPFFEARPCFPVP